MRARVPVTLGLVTILFACQDHAGTLGPDEASSARAPAAASFSTASRIAQLRRLVAPFHDFETAKAAGWSAPITPCWVAADLPSQPGSGAMGFHWGNLDYILDGGKVDLLQPELLLYEPEKNGKLRFVGVEYIVLFSDHPSTAEPPTLLGQEFSRVPEAGVWGLHIWVGRENSAGIFMPWNEKVSCEFAAGATAAGHHHGE
ncbi:MAG TPA: hypothetical protein VF046_01250 [Gemmatimonadales bacterium]|jgi:hypothetical protein